VQKSVHQDEQKLLQNLLRRLRKQAGLRQVDLAARLNGPQQIVSRFESGVRMLDLLELRQVCHALGLTLPEFATMFEDELQRHSKGSQAIDG
jgi:transcriptional regulator with XRE-family HTH domain